MDTTKLTKTDLLELLAHLLWALDNAGVLNIYLFGLKFRDREDITAEVIRKTAELVDYDLTYYD